MRRIFDNYILIVILLLFILNASAHAYIGPGAGFALISSLSSFFFSFIIAFSALLTWPVRVVYHLIRYRHAYARAKFDRVIILGLDGLDPELCDRFMSQGLMPNLHRMKKEGSYFKLATTFPALSPVAWSTFATGVNPARHNIYDFITRNPRTLLPELSSSRIVLSDRTIHLGTYHFPLQKPIIQFLRKSKSFWKILGEKGIFSHIIRVPITYPPEKFNGALLSAMCTPDLQGTQGSFSYYTNDPHPSTNFTGGKRFQLEKRGEEWWGVLQGPDHPHQKPTKPLTIRFRLKVDQEGLPISLHIGRKKYPIVRKEFTPWIPITFRAGWMLIRGMCQFYLKADTPFIELYGSPINVDPERPAFPISTPHYFSMVLSKLHGRYSTLGLAEDTWALNEHVLDEEGFLKQAYHLFEEREKQFFSILSKMSRGVCACVFDGTDRIQHMFFRYLVQDHPANRHAEKQTYQNAIADVYQKADEIIGRVLGKLSKDSLFLVLSDHGFKSFQRGVNLNAWLLQNGYLTLNNNWTAADYLQNVDWSRTRAYALGLAGIYLNLQGRESHGIVSRSDAALLRKELVEKLSGLYDRDRQTTAINSVFEAEHIYNGPYLEHAPDLIVAYNEGYRISWAGALGNTTMEVFEDNTKNWSGDHGVDPRIVPGIFACNHAVEAHQPHIADVAPTMLDLFGIDIPAYMDGKPWLINASKG